MRVQCIPDASPRALGLRHAWLPTVPEMGPDGGVVPKLAPWTVRKGSPLGGPFTGDMAVPGGGLRFGVWGLGFGI